MSDHRHHDPRPETSLTHTREDSGNKPLATSTPMTSPRKGEECRRQKEESCHDNKVRKNNYPHSSPSKTSLRLEEEMKRELGLWNNNNSRCTITGTKRRQWKLPSTDQQRPEEETMPTNTNPRSLTTTWTNPRTIPRTEPFSMGTSSNHCTKETNMQDQQAASSISRNSNQRMPTWITMASSNINRSTMSREITSTNQNPNTSISRIREGSNDPQSQIRPSFLPHHHQQHNSLSRAILLHHNRLDNSHQGPRHQRSNEGQCAQPQELLNQPESFLSLELQPLPPPPPCRTGSKEQLHLHISISSPSLFEESFGSQDSCINTTAQPARLGPF